MKQLVSLTLTVFLMLAAVFSAAAWEYDDFPVFPESNVRSPKRDAAAVLTQSDTPLGAFAEPDAECVSVLFYEDAYVQTNLNRGLPEEEFTVCDYDKDHGNYKCLVMSYYAQNAFEVTFTVEEAGLYEFRFDCVTDDSGRGAYLQIDDGVFFDAYLQYKWPNPISMYGMFVELTAGEHVMKLYGHETKPTYAQGFAYTLIEAREVVTEAEAETKVVIMTRPVETEPVPVETAPTAAAEESASPWGMFALATVWIAAAIAVFAAVMTAAPQKKK